jgi:hypothetical protein
VSLAALWMFWDDGVHAVSTGTCDVLGDIVGYLHCGSIFKEERIRL